MHLVEKSDGQGVGGCMQWPWAAGARIGEQEMDAVPACKRRLDDALRCVVFRHIDGQRLDEVRIADRLFESRELVRVATDAEHRDAGFSKFDGRTEADATAGTGDDCYLPVTTPFSSLRCTHSSLPPPSDGERGGA